ncbi:tape measure protein [Acinetobacter johnsonii]|uniref:tape measure protein n=1 Tax=Acinetobacter johnsonii TaxID=40214 RepID=UPI00244C460A|nr:tape measure protein [Acinetobacter johnsonii]MDH1408017.1 tape measure protein [Acinetobacter johnsonii]
MSGKNLTFKLIMDGDSKGLVAAAKQSEAVTKKVFDSIKAEADQLKQASTDTAKALGSIVPEKSKELADGLTKSLSGATQIIRDAGDNAKSAASNFTDFGNKSVKALAFLKSDLEKAKSRLEAFSKTKATPVDIEIAQKQVDQLEKEVQQAESAFIDFHTEVGKANNSLKHTDTAAQTAQKGLNGAKFAVNALAGAMAALGVGLGIRELAQTADTYTNLSARINIATKEGGDFTSAMAGVHQVALMTNSSLSATGDLFTRLNAVGKDLGMTQQNSLDLTKTINQAIQISGVSAQASEAFTQQFIQSMQQGTLRGEEYNSMMENGYGVAEALAKGLGVTTGELKNMADNGELGAERVYKALLSQKDAVQQTFDQFPTTIGNALTKISTQWQILIGEMDQANGSSAKVANALSIIADNLGILKVFFDDVAEGVGYFTSKFKDIEPSTLDALRNTLAQVYENIKLNIKYVADFGETAWSAFTSAMDAISPLFNALVGGGEDVSGFTTLLNMLRMAMAGVSDASFGLNVGLKLLLSGIQFLAGGIYSLAAATLRYIPFMGDLADEAEKSSDRMFAQAEKNAKGAIKLAEDHKWAVVKTYEDINKTQEQKNSESLAQSKATLDQMLANQQTETNSKKVSEAEKLSAVQAYAEAAIKANGGVMDGVMQADLITKGYIVTIDEAGKVSVQAGVSAAQAAENAKVKEEALKVAKENVKKADEEYLAYQKQAAIERAALEQQIEQAKRTGDLNALASAQTSLAGIDTKEAELANNRTTRINELNQLNSGAGQVVEGAAVRARKAATALGIDLDIALGRVSEKFAADQVHLNNYANGFDELGLKGEQATNALYTGWEKWVATAKSQVELDAAKAKLQSFGDQGKLSTSQVEMGLQAIKRASQELPAALSPAEAAMERLGIKSKEQLKLAAENALTDLDTVMKSGEATQEGLQKAYEETVRLAQASGNAQVMAAANAKAAYLGLEVQLDATGKATVSKLGEIQQAAIETQRTVSQVSQVTSREQPEISPEQQATNDHWDDFKAKMKARTDELNAKSQARGSGGGNASLLSNGGDSTQQISAVPDAPLIATSLDIQPMEGMETKQSVEIKIDMGTGQTATVSAAPDQATALEEMMRELEAIKGRS